MLSPPVFLCIPTKNNFPPPTDLVHSSLRSFSWHFLFFYNNVAKFFFKKKCIFSVKSFGIAENTTIFASKSFNDAPFDIAHGGDFHNERIGLTRRIK